MATSRYPRKAIPTLKLANGVSIPAIGFGSGTAWYKGKGGDKLAPAILSALDAGYRYFDSAEMYGNETQEAVALQKWLNRPGSKREELFLLSKLLPSIDTGIKAGCQCILKKLGVTYLDMLLLHAPFNQDGKPFRKPLISIWKDMEALVDAKMVRSIGVSNWRIADLEQIHSICRIKPCVNQIEYHPFLQQPKLNQWCKEHKILVMSYSGLSSLTTRCTALDTAVRSAAKRVGHCEAAVLLRWCFQGGHLPVTTTSKPVRLSQYMETFAFELTDQEMCAISKAGQSQPLRRYWTQCPQFNSDPSKEVPADV